jgi:hypothetical protein
VRSRDSALCPPSGPILAAAPAWAQALYDRSGYPPAKAAQAADRLKAGEAWHDTGLVFTTTIGTMFDQHNIRRGFRQITQAGPGR